MRKKLLNIGNGHSRFPRSGAFIEALQEIGDLTVVPNGNQLSDHERAELIRDCHILLTMWGSAKVPNEIAADRGKLEYICNITGTLREWISLDIIDAGIPVTNWGDAMAFDVAEAAMTLLLATLKDLHLQVDHVRSGGWHLAEKSRSGTIEGLNVGIYGLGVIGQRFLELIRPFHPILRIFDPYVAQLPDDCMRVNSLDELFSQSQAIVLHAGWTKETENSVTAELLAMLPDGGIVINTARGAIIDQQALFAELRTGRLRAGLDVLAGNDTLEPGHPAREWDNCIFTAHDLPLNSWNKPVLERYQVICLDNLRRHIAGQPLRFTMDRARYLRST